MLYDICQSPVSIDDTEALAKWNATVLAFLAHGSQTPVHLTALMQQAPDFVMGHAARGLFSMMMGRRELLQTAQEAAAIARRIAGQSDITQREHGWVDALDHWLAGAPSQSVDTLETVLRAHPQDTITAKVIHAIRFILGDVAGMRRSVERVLGAHGSDHPCRGYLLGCHAFALEETGDYAAAARAGRAGLVCAPDDAWGLHAVAHVYDMTARPDLGIRLIEDNVSAWDHCNNFRYHVWWHKALLHMDRGETDVALGLYDAQIRADNTDDYRDISNATSLLVRLELEGLPVGNRWEELADLAEKRIDDGCVVFADLHYMLALTGAERGAAQRAMADRFARDAQQHGDMHRRYAHPGQAALSGLNAFAEARYDEAFAALLAARPDMQSIGGSHAQRDVFERITIDAGFRAGRYAQTRRLVLERVALRGGAQDRYAQDRLTQLDRAQRIAAQ